MRRILGIVIAVIVMIYWGNLPVQSEGNPIKIDIRQNSFNPTLKVSDIESYYAEEYGSGWYDEEAYSKLEWDKSGKTSGFGLDFKYGISPSTELVFSIDSLKDIEGAIAGVGYDITLDEYDIEVDAVTIKDIQLFTFGVNYIFTPDKPVKTFAGAGLQSSKYKVTDEGAWLLVDGATGAILAEDYWSDSDSVSKIGLSFWAGADVYLSEKFFVNLSGRYYNLSDTVFSDVSVTLKGLAINFGVGLQF